MRIHKKEKPLNANLMYDSSLNIVSEFKDLMVLRVAWGPWLLYAIPMALF